MQKQINELKEELGINRIIIIDDELKEDDDLQELSDGFHYYKIGRKMLERRNELKASGLFTDKEINSIKNDSYVINDQDGNLIKRIRDFLISKELYNRNGISQQLVNLQTFLHEQFEGVDIKTYGEIIDTIDIKDKDLVIVDYDLTTQTGEEILGKIRNLLEKKHTEINDDENKIFSIKELYHVLFISSKTQFASYSLIKPLEKNEYFRVLRKKYCFYQCIVFNYLNKDLLDNDKSEELNNQFRSILYEYKLTRVFFDFLNGLYEQIALSKSEVFKDFYTLNLKTLKSIIDEKIEQEGIPEFKFFNDLICNLIIKKNSDMDVKNIYDLISSIKEIDESIEDYYLDNNLLDIRKKEVYEYINNNTMPVDFGDIFQLELNSGEMQNLLLISQQCDLALRNTGDRKLKNATLLKDDRGNGCYEKLDYYEIEESKDGKKLKKYFWDKRDPVMLPCDILDLTSINKEGISLIKLDSDVDTLVKDLVSMSQKECIKKEYNQLLASITSKEKELQDSGIIEDLKNKFRIITINGIMVYYKKVNENEFWFNVKRIKRLDGQIAHKIKQEYLNLFDRIGLNLDISDTCYISKEVPLEINEKKNGFLKVKIEDIEIGEERRNIMINIDGLVEHLKDYCDKSKVYCIRDITDKINTYNTNHISIMDNLKYTKLTNKNVKELKALNVDIDIDGKGIKVDLNDLKKIIVDDVELKHNDQFEHERKGNKLYVLLSIFKKFREHSENNNEMLTELEKRKNLKDKKFLNVFDPSLKELIEFICDEEDKLKIKEKEV